MTASPKIGDEAEGSPFSAYGRDFRFYVIGQAISVVGDRVALIALVFLVIHLTHEAALAVALFYICQVLPTLAGGLLAGVLADHFDRRRLMLGTDLGRAALLVFTPTLTDLGVWLVYPVVIALYAMTVLFNTTARAALPDIIPEARMMGANSVLSGIQNLADLGYALGGGLVFVLGVRVPVYIDALTFLFSASMIYVMRFPHQDRQSLSGLGETGARIRAGIAYLFSHPFLKWSTFTFMAAPIAGGAAFVLVPLYASRVLAQSSGLIGPLRGGAFRFSILEVALGLGALLGSALATRLGRRLPRGRVFAIGVAGTGAADMLLAAVTNIYLASAVMVVSGFFNSLFVISGITLVQSLTPSEMRGRVVAARITIINGGLAFGSALGGLLLLSFSIRMLWLLEGGVIIMSSLFIWLRRDVREQQ